MRCAFDQSLSPAVQLHVLITHQLHKVISAKTEIWQRIHEWLPWFDGAVASIVIILIKAIALVASIA
jgi:hypothetical protein